MFFIVVFLNLLLIYIVTPVLWNKGSLFQFHDFSEMFSIFKKNTLWQVLFIDTVHKKSIRFKLERTWTTTLLLPPPYGLSINQSFGWFIHMPCQLPYWWITVVLSSSFPLSTFQVLKATTMTSVMFLQDLKSKNTQVSSKAKITGAVRSALFGSALLWTSFCTLSYLSALLDFTATLDFWISRFLDFWTQVEICSEIQICAEQRCVNPARLLLPLLGLCTENEQTYWSILILASSIRSVWHQQISSKTPSWDTKHKNNLWLKLYVAHNFFQNCHIFAHTH